MRYAIKTCKDNMIAPIKDSDKDIYGYNDENINCIV
jgi:hypothetical protein